MPKKPGKIGDKKVSRVDDSGNVEATEKTESVEGAQSIEGVGAIGEIGTIDRSGSRVTHRLSSSDREQLFHLISDEAKKLFDGTDLTEEKRKLIEEAVKMAVDSGLVEEGEGSEGSDS